MAAAGRAARRTALVLLYQWDVTGQPLGSLYEGEVDELLARARRGRGRRGTRSSTARITEASENGPPTGSARSSATSSGSRSYELDRGEVPVEVAIDEAVELAKRYASEDAGRLVNGILGRIVREKKDARHDRGGPPAGRPERAAGDRLEETRAQLEQTTDPDEAIEILAELAEIAKEVEAQLQQAKREAER